LVMGPGDRIGGVLNGPGEQPDLLFAEQNLCIRRAKRMWNSG